MKKVILVYMCGLLLHTTTPAFRTTEEHIQCILDSREHCAGIKMNILIAIKNILCQDNI